MVKFFSVRRIMIAFYVSVNIWNLIKFYFVVIELVILIWILDFLLTVYRPKSSHQIKTKNGLTEMDQFGKRFDNFQNRIEWVLNSTSTSFPWNVLTHFYAMKNHFKSAKRIIGGNFYFTKKLVRKWWKLGQGNKLGASTNYFNDV